jgi:hypothetical protein
MLACQRASESVLEHGAEPLLCLLYRDFLPRRVGDDLVLGDLANGEVLAALAGKVEAADGRSGLHGEALCEADARVLLYIHQGPHGFLLQMVRLGWVPWGRPDPCRYKSSMPLL